MVSNLSVILTLPKLITFQFIGIDACTVPILTPQEAGQQTSNIPAFHPQLTSRMEQEIPGDSKNVIIKPGTHTHAVLREYGLEESRIRELEDAGVLGNEPRRSSSKL